MEKFEVPDGNGKLQYAYAQGAIAAVISCGKSWREFEAFFKGTNLLPEHYMQILVQHEAESTTFLFKDKRYKALITMEVEK